MARVELDKLTFAYPGADEAVLEDINLTIENGEAHALLGASGAGKTTLLNLLSGLLVPTSGSISFDGRDVSRQPGRERKVAQVFQFPVLYESLSVEDNLAFPLRKSGMTPDQIEVRVGEIADELEISGIRNRRSTQLSLFEKQLVAVGKALVRPDVSLVLLDEPLTAVEPRVKWQLRQTLKKVQADLDVTMVYVTHDQTEALTFADRVTVLTVDGVLQTGTPEEIYATPQHEFVGHFVGSPGMNFLPNHVVDEAHGDKIGFRPEWVQLSGTGVVEGQVVRTRALSSQEGQPYGITTVATDHGEINVRGTLSAEEGATTGLKVDQYVVFADGWRVA